MKSYRLSRDWVSYSIILVATFASIVDLAVSKEAFWTSSTVFALAKPLAIVILLLASKKTSSQRISPLAALGVCLAFGSPIFFQTLPHFQLSSANILPLYIGSAVFYILFVLAAHFNLGRNFSITPAYKGVSDDGLYKLVRHPIYTGYLGLSLIFLAFNLSVANIIVFLLLALGLHLRSVEEEKVLQEHSQDYVKYLRLTKFRFFHPAVMLPALITLGFQSFNSLNADVSATRAIKDKLDIQLAYPVQSLNPTIYDDWSSVFVANHVLRPLLNAQNNTALEAVSDSLDVECLPSSESCSESTLRIKFNTFDDCMGRPYRVSDLVAEFYEILDKKKWLVPGWKKCELLESSEACIVFPTIDDIQRRMEAIYFRFGWSKLQESDASIGAGPYCARYVKRSGGTITSAIVDWKGQPSFHFSTSTSSDGIFDAALYGSEDLVNPRRRNIAVNTPLGYYFVTHKKFANVVTPWNTEKFAEILRKRLTQSKTIFDVSSSFMMNFLPSGSAISGSQSNLPKETVATIILPDYLAKCQEVSQDAMKYLGQIGYAKIKIECQDLLKFQKSHVWPVSGDGLFDAFLSPLSPGAPMRNAILIQYFSSTSAESYTSDYPTPDKLFYLVGVGPTEVTINSSSLCDIKSTSLGLSNLMIDDFIACKKD